MYKLSEITLLHIELTDKCQAACPMCARNFHGGKTRPFIKNKDITIQQFKEWFPKTFLLQLENFYSCGNYGDPALSTDCLEIFSYVREVNSNVRLAIHTNGGMRNSDWWKKLAKVLGKNSEVVFAVDGLKDTHTLYRKNTNFDKIISNLTAFVSAGGNARVDSLVFAHNQHQVTELENFLLELGVKKVNFFSTQRFYEMNQFEVQNTKGNVEYFLEPATTERFKKTTILNLEHLVDKQYRKNAIRKAVIEPKCVSENGIYVDPYGNILPCCWIGSDYLEEPIEETLPIHYLRNISVETTKLMLDDIGVPNCKDGVLYDDHQFWPTIDNYWNADEKCLTCARQCSKMIYNVTNKYE